MTEVNVNATVVACEAPNRRTGITARVTSFACACQEARVHPLVSVPSKIHWYGLRAPTLFGMVPRTGAHERDNRR